MGKWQPLSNLRSYLEHHPPAVIFFLCMLMLSLTFIGIGFYTQTHSVRNPDATPDWNQFLESIANLRFCVPGNGTTEAELASVARKKTDKQSQDRTSQDIEQRFLLVPLMLNGASRGETPTFLSAEVLGNQVGLKGAAEKEVFNMSLMMYPHTPTTGLEHSLPPLNCLQLKAPAVMLPKTPSPPECPGQQKEASGLLNTRAYPVDMQTKVPPSFHCHRLAFTPDDSLTAYLSQDERTLVGKHLLFVSAALLVICGLLCFSASLPCSRSRRYHGNDLGLHKEPLLES